MADIGKSSLFSLPRHLRLQLCSLGELPVCLPAHPPVVKVLLFHRIEYGAQLSCERSTSVSVGMAPSWGTYQASKDRWQ